MRSKNIYQTIGAFGGRSYRAMLRGEEIVLQESNQGRRWRNIAKTEAKRFFAMAEEMDIYNPYRQDPAHLLNIAIALNS